MSTHQDYLHHVPTAQMPDLPPNWTRHSDTQGREYFHNTLTNETTWLMPTQPTLPPAPAPAPPPPPESSYPQYSESLSNHPGFPNNTPQNAWPPQHANPDYPHHANSYNPSSQPVPPHSQHQPTPQYYQSQSPHSQPPPSQPLQSQPPPHYMPPSLPHPHQPQQQHPNPQPNHSTPFAPMFQNVEYSNHISNPGMNQPPHPNLIPNPPGNSSSNPTPTPNPHTAPVAPPFPAAQYSYPDATNSHPQVTFEQPTTAQTISMPQQFPSYPTSSGPIPSNSMNHASASVFNVASSYNLVSSISLPMDQSGSVVYIKMEVRAVDLRKRDFIGTSDPICYLQVPERRTLNVTKKTKWKSIAKTEVVNNSTSPSWSKRFRVPFLFEQHQPLRFYLVDVDNVKTQKGDNLGICVVPLANIVRNGSVTESLTDTNGRKGKFGKLTIRAHDENAAGQVRLKLSLAAKSLTNVEFMGKSDPFYQIHCLLPNGSAATNLCTSETIMNNLSPVWKLQKIIVPTGGHPWEKVELNVKVFDWNKTLKHRLIGETTFALSELVQNPPSSFTLINHNKNKKFSRNKGCGDLLVLEAKAQKMPNFISYVQGGLRLKFVVAVDFTSSNRPVGNVDSLHYMGDPSKPSVYAQALNAVGSVVGSYIPDGFITALGFGAKLPGCKEASFDFSMSGNPDPRVLGVGGLLSAYEKAAHSVKLSGPTRFTPLIQSTMKLCQGDPVSQNNQNFTILLILTDGLITDMKETIDTIIDASYSSPLSIVIVGVGKDDFSAMERLDSDDKKLCSEDGKRVAKHDIVQFTKFDSTDSLEALAAEVLHEVPSRLVEYMMDAGIKPNEVALGGGGVPQQYGGGPPMYPPY